MKRLITVFVSLAVMMVATVGPAAAAPPPRSHTVANPGQVAAIISSYTGQDFGSLTRRLAGGDLTVPAGDPMEMCAEYEAGVDFGGGEVFQLTYPYTFYGDAPAEELPPGWPLLTANNRRQCAIALYTFHNLAPFFFGGGE